jgi:hypothetical protein
MAEGYDDFDMGDSADQERRSMDILFGDGRPCSACTVEYHEGDEQCEECEGDGYKRYHGN